MNSQSNSTAELLANTVLSGFTPPPQLTLSQWADEHYYLSAESSAEVGRWKTLPYQREPMDMVTDPDCETISWMKSARVGYTKILNATVGYHMDYAPCPIMLVQPSDDDAKEYSKDEIFPMLRDVPRLSALIREPVPGEPQESLTYKPFKGGVIHMVGAISPKSFRRVSRKIILLDEVDGYPVSAGDEGDPERLAIKRSEYYWDRKIIRGSTPTIDGHSRIHRAFEQGDQRHFYVPCPHCKEEQVLKFPNLKWPKGKPEEAAFACEHCGVLIEYRYQRWMVENGRWIAHAPENFTRYRHASFHIWQAYSYSPNATWGQIATDFENAKKEGPEGLKTFVNTVLGEVWKDKGEAPDWERLYERRENYPIGSVPAGGLFITCGVDVQKHGFIYVVKAWGRGKESWLVDWGTLAGDPSLKATQNQLDALLNHSYPHEHGVSMPISTMAVDSGAFTQTVYNWCRKYPMQRVMAIKGMPRGSVLLGAPVSIDVNINGKRMARGYKYWPVGGAVAKTEIYGFLKLDKPTEESKEPFPPGYCHHPQVGEDYFKQLTGEQLIPKRNKRGYVNMEWQKIPGRENHVLDGEVYARAAAAHFGLDRLNEDEWKALEMALVAKAEKKEDDAPTDGGAHKGRIAPRSKGWLKGGR